ncbi:nucleoside hydrolase [Vibrio chagasii]|nr:nucleoside hydrolase [Vibrio chagasii]
MLSREGASWRLVLSATLLLALEAAPDIVDLVKEVVIMGGDALAKMTTGAM